MGKSARAKARVAAGADGEAWLALFDSMGAAAFRLDARTLEITFLGQGARQLLGDKCRSGRLGRAFWAKAVPAEDLLAVFEAFRGAARDGQPRAVEHRLKRTRGTGWVRTSVVRAQPEGRDPDLLVGSMLDITTSRENERQWQEMESWLVTLGEALPFDLWICDSDGRCVLQNPASVRRIGDRVGSQLSEAPWRGAFERAMRGELVREERDEDCAAGRCFFVRVVSPVHGVDGIRGALGVDIEVTELKQVEARLRQSLDELAKAQDTAVRSSQLAAIGQMAAVVAHEVRNPLGSIANAVALLGKDAARSGVPLDDLRRIIADEAARIEWLVRNLLELARPMVPELKPRSIAAQMEEALADTLRAEGAQEIRVNRRIDAALEPVPVDTKLLQLALTNVFRNAVQAMRGKGELEVGLAREADEGGAWARLTIRDSGPGISPEHRGRLFEPFFTTRSTGNGLGLAIIKRVVQEHRGSVDLQSEAGQGTSCVIRLPLPGRTG